MHRRISTRLLFLYGLGTTLGAGIYALIGEVAREAGMWAPAAFLIASVIAAFTAASFAEFASRYPRAAGEAVYVSAGFSSTSLALVVGCLIIASGVLSSGVMLQGLVGYAHEFIAFPDIVGLLALAVVMGGLAAWGISESLIVIAAVTIIEAGVLLAIIGLGVGAEVAPQPELTGGAVSGVVGVMSAATLAFYAFIGFEDMVNVAEEVREPRRAIPLAIFGALGVTTLIYIGVAWVSVRTTPISDLADSSAPMALVVRTVTDWPSAWVSLVALFALANGALVQIIMASRVLYGLARQNLLPSWLGRVNGVTRTPVMATMLVSAGVFAVTVFPLDTLAKATTFALLVVFALVNAALIRVKAHDPDGEAVFHAPTVMPWLGLVSASLFALFSLVALVRG